MEHEKMSRFTYVIQCVYIHTYKYSHTHTHNVISGLFEIDFLKG